MPHSGCCQEGIVFVRLCYNFVMMLFVTLFVIMQTSCLCDHADIFPRWQHLAMGRRVGFALPHTTYRCLIEALLSSSSLLLLQVSRMLVECSQPVNDGQWHILTIKRRAKELEARVDNCRPATGLYNVHLISTHHIAQSVLNHSLE